MKKETEDTKELKVVNKGRKHGKSCVTILVYIVRRE